MSGYWVIITPVALIVMAGMVVIARRLAYRPQHAAAYRGELAADWPTVGSMNLYDEEAGRLGTWTPHPDPWAGHTAELPVPLERTLRAQLGRVDKYEPADQLTVILAKLEPLEPEPYDVLLAEEVRRAVRLLDAETGLYLAELTDRAEGYLAEVRCHL